MNTLATLVILVVFNTGVQVPMKKDMTYRHCIEAVRHGQFVPFTSSNAVMYVAMYCIPRKGMSL